jgi:hypothetical protein
LIRLAGELNTARPEIIEDRLVVDQFPENRNGLLPGGGLGELNGVPNPKTHAKMGGPTNREFS